MKSGLGVVLKNGVNCPLRCSLELLQVTGRASTGLQADSGSPRSSLWYLLSECGGGGAACFLWLWLEMEVMRISVV